MYIASRKTARVYRHFEGYKYENGSPPKKFTNPIIGEAGIVEFSNYVNNTTEGSGVHGHVIRGTHVRCILTISSTNTLPLISGCPDLFSCPPTTNPNELTQLIYVH